MTSNQCTNFDRELWREPGDDFYADSIHVTREGGIGINCGGLVIVKPLRDWHALARDAEKAAAESAEAQYQRERAADETTACPRLQSILRDAHTIHDEAREECCGATVKSVETSTWRCTNPNCGQENFPESDWCRQCGADKSAAAQSCWTCGAPAQRAKGVYWYCADHVPPA